MGCGSCDHVRDWSSRDLSRLQELKDLPIEELAHDPEWTRIAVWAVLDGA
jgi:hypothetical protein